MLDCALLRLGLLHLTDSRYPKATSIERHRHLLALAAGHGRLFLGCERLAFAGDSECLERAKYRIGGTACLLDGLRHRAARIAGGLLAHAGIDLIP
ncbi:hypothetical protein [Aeromonas caviae]|uniref:hypothetical protein n=1 Tax=Aeromonas caviae TaxID=648 RepID=UPI002442C9CD|nr:hypothetical protein [Aeromonas caviae]